MYLASTFLATHSLMPTSASWKPWEAYWIWPIIYLSFFPQQESIQLQLSSFPSLQEEDKSSKDDSEKEKEKDKNKDKNSEKSKIRMLSKGELKNL